MIKDGLAELVFVHSVEMLVYVCVCECVMWHALARDIFRSPDQKLHGPREGEDHTRVRAPHTVLPSPSHSNKQQAAGFCFPLLAETAATFLCSSFCPSSSHRMSSTATSVAGAGRTAAQAETLNALDRHIESLVSTLGRLLRLQGCSLLCFHCSGLLR